MSKWFPIESNPDVMNKYIKSLGLSNPAVEFVDVYGVSDDLLSMVPHPVRAVSLVYPITTATETFLKEKTTTQKSEVEAFRKEHPFFYTKQYVGNACGTIAILHALVNNTSHLGTIADGSVLAQLVPKLQGVSETTAGNIISENQSLASAHASAAEDGATANQDIDADIDLHFVTFVKVADRCVELDGRQDNPILHGTCSTEAEFLQAAAAVISERMALVPESIEFGITALVDTSD